MTSSLGNFSSLFPTIPIYCLDLLGLLSDCSIFGMRGDDEGDERVRVKDDSGVTSRDSEEEDGIEDDGDAEVEDLKRDAGG